MKRLCFLLIVTVVSGLTFAADKCAAERYKWEYDKNSEILTEALRACEEAPIKKQEMEKLRTPSNRYQGAFIAAQLSCPIALRLANDRATIGEMQNESSDWKGCIAKSKIELRAAYDAYSKTLKKPSAKAALKEHFIIATSVISGIEPDLDERVVNYDKRQTDLKARANEQWTRFEIEN